MHKAKLTTQALRLLTIADAVTSKSPEESSPQERNTQTILSFEKADGYTLHLLVMLWGQVLFTVHYALTLFICCTATQDVIDAKWNRAKIQPAL